LHNTESTVKKIKKIYDVQTSKKHIQSLSRHLLYDSSLNSCGFHPLSFQHYLVFWTRLATGSSVSSFFRWKYINVPCN